MNVQIETECIHGNLQKSKDMPFGAVTVPIFQVATFGHPGIGQSTGYDYSRVSNPTRDCLEETVKILEHGCDCIATSSGMSAIGLVLELLAPGAHVVASEDLYGGSVRLFDHEKEKKNVSVSYVNTGDIDAVEAAIRESTKALYIETPSNPMMEVTDLARIKEVADRHGLLVIVDNTFLSPYLQNPIDFGADIVVHSGTKFLSGHNDTIAGFVVTSRPELAEKLRLLYKTTGVCLSPFDSFLVLRGIKTLAVRMDRQQENAKKIALWLSRHDKIERVYYVGLPEHPGYETNAGQARGSGSMISFKLDSASSAQKLLSKLRLITFAESLGGVESLITYPKMQTHAYLSEDMRQKLGITDELLRLSVGIENVDDLILDLQQALD